MAAILYSECFIVLRQWSFNRDRALVAPLARCPLLGMSVKRGSTVDALTLFVVHFCKFLQYTLQGSMWDRVFYFIAACGNSKIM